MTHGTVHITMTPEGPEVSASGDIVDVQFILGETPVPKTTDL